jgi:hypothetical protein
LQSIIDNLETHATLRTRQRKTKQKAQHTLKKMSSTDPTKTSRATPGAREQHVLLTSTWSRPIWFDGVGTAREHLKSP